MYQLNRNWVLGIGKLVYIGSFNAPSCCQAILSLNLLTLSQNPPITLQTSR
jgi:hypothetical protein